MTMAQATDARICEITSSENEKTGITKFFDNRAVKIYLNGKKLQVYIGNTLSKYTFVSDKKTGMDKYNAHAYMRADGGLAVIHNDFNGRSTLVHKGISLQIENCKKIKDNR